MARRKRDDEEIYEEEEVHEEEVRPKRRRYALFNDEDDEEDEDDHGGRSKRRRKRKPSAAVFIDSEAVHDDAEEEEDEESGDDDFIDNNAAELQEEIDVRSRAQRRPFLPQEEEQEVNVEDFERRIQERYMYDTNDDEDYDENDLTDVELRSLLPSVKDCKLWKVPCAVGHEREAVVCLMQKSIAKGGEMHIKSALALDHLKNCIYVEADKEAHVKEACKGLRNIYSAKILLVPLTEMTDVLSVRSKAIELSPGMWIHMKTGIYKGDLAKVVDVDDMHQRVTVKLIPRIVLQDIADKMGGREVVKKKGLPAQRFMNTAEARNMGIRVERWKDQYPGHYFDKINGMKFKDGLLYKMVSMKSISWHNIEPTLDEFEKFQEPGDANIGRFSTSLASRKRGCFVKGDAVIVVKGDLKNLTGSVEKVEEEYVHIKPNLQDMSTFTVHENHICKYLKSGDHVKVVSGSQEGATGMVVKVEGHVLIISKDSSQEEISVFADHVVETSEVTSGVTRIGDYELHDLVLLNNDKFGVIIRVESGAFQVLMGVSGTPETTVVNLREIKRKLSLRNNTNDRDNNVVSVKDVVTVLVHAKENKGSWNMFINRCCLSKIGITMSMLVMYV